MDLDRISSLPDPIICHILSFLSTKDAARTSALSTGWKDLFLSVPKFILDLEEVRLGRNASQNLDFINFVNRRLTLSKTSINEFRLKRMFFPEDDDSVFEFWLTTLVSLKPEVIDIASLLPIANPLLYLPRKIFTCETLVVFKLSGPCFVVKIPQSVHFPKLKVLHLDTLAVQFPSDRWMFAQGYPVIEDLRLERVEVSRYRRGSLGIYLKTLLKLAILYVDDLWRLEIDAPRLQHLVTNCCWPGTYCCTAVNLFGCESIVSAELVQVHIPLLDQVNYVKELHIVRGLLEVSPELLISLPLFPNLTKLKLRSSGKTMGIMLEQAPILTELFYNMNCKYLSSLPENVPECVANSLRVINVVEFEGGEADCAAVRYFLNHAAVLEKMTIELPDGGIQELPSSILNQKRRSPNCEIKILKCSKSSIYTILSNLTEIAE